MAKQIIVLDTLPKDGGLNEIAAIFWYPVSVGREVPLPNFVSKLRSISTQETADLQAGKFVEEFFSYQVPSSASAATVKAQLVSIYASKKAIFDAKPNPNTFYAVYYDGAAWSA